MNWIKKSFVVLFTIMMLMILSLVLFSFSQTQFSHKRDFFVNQQTMLAGGLIAMAAICVCFTLMGKEKARDGLWSKITGLVPWGILLCIQLVLCFHAYFITGWDVRGILDCAYAFAGGYADIHIAYLSMYHNNVPLVMLFSAIIRVLRMMLGNVGMDRCVYVLIAFQCLLNTMAGFLCRWVALKITSSRRCANCISLVYSLFIGISPWLMIPYSDSVALFFPIAIAAVYFLDVGDEKKWIKWGIIGVLSGFGYMIKPQVLISTIAIGIVECIRIVDMKKIRKGILHLLSMLAVLIAIVGPVKSAILELPPVELRPHQRMNLLHYVMMGLGTKTNGAYDWDDVVLSSTQQSLEEKRAVQIPEIKRRLKDMGAGGLSEHLKKKMLTNYADGSFAWAREGEFYRIWIEDKDDVLSPFLKSLIYVGSDRFPYLLMYFQCIWLALLTGCAFEGLFLCKKRRMIDSKVCVLMLSVIGITIFQLIFECRARYLYLYAPFYVLLGVSGIWHMVEKLFKAIRCNIELS